MKRKGQEIETIVIVVVALAIGLTVAGVVFGWWEVTGEFILNMLTD